MIDRRTMIGLTLAAIPAVACSKPARATEIKDNVLACMMKSPIGAFAH